MEKPRNIVLVLGNGFDLDLGRKTSYKDFWESEFCPKDYPAPLIRHLNQRWKDGCDAVKWYDLENELLEYYISNSSATKWEDVVSDEELEFLREYDAYKYSCGQYDDKIDLINGLIEKRYIYIANQLLQTLRIPYLEDYKLSIRERDYKAVQLIKDGLCKYLCKIDRSCNSESAAFKLLNCIADSNNDDTDISVYSFNYTDISLIDSRFDKLPMFYIHGSCKNNRVIIGTKDDDVYDTNYDFLQKSFDDNFYPPRIVPELMKADEVIIFGHSLGVNDQQYFKSLFERQTNTEYAIRKEIVFFTYDNKSEIEIKRSLQKMTGSNLAALYSLNDIHIIKTSSPNEGEYTMDDFLSEFKSETSTSSDISM